MNNELKIGIIGLDTSHVVAFTELLNDSSRQYHIPGAKVVVAYPGGSPDFELSYSRVEGFTNTLRSDFGVPMAESIEEVAEKSDAILLESVDGRVHLEIFKRLVPYGKPVFIDKPLTVNSREAKEIIDLANQAQIPIMSSSALRFSVGVREGLNMSDRGEIIGADCFGPMAIEPTQPGLFWYGIHSVEMLYTMLGAGCVTVTASTNADHDLVVGTWKDGRIGTIRGNRRGNGSFGALVHRERHTHFVDVSTDSRPFYVGLLENIIEMFKTRESKINVQETWEVIRFIEAANESRETGATVSL